MRSFARDGPAPALLRAAAKPHGADYCSTDRYVNGTRTRESLRAARFVQRFARSCLRAPRRHAESVAINPALTNTAPREAWGPWADLADCWCPVNLAAKRIAIGVTVATSRLISAVSRVWERWHSDQRERVLRDGRLRAPRPLPRDTAFTAG